MVSKIGRRAKRIEFFFSDTTGAATATTHTHTHTHTHTQTHPAHLVLLAGVELDAVRHLLVGEAPHTLARLRVPQAHHAVVAGRQEARAVVVVANVAHALCVAWCAGRRDWRECV